MELSSRHRHPTSELVSIGKNLIVAYTRIKYKLLSKSHLNFVPTDHPRKGSTPTEVLEFMLQEVQGITPSAAAGIAAVYPSFRALMEAYEKAERKGGVGRAEGMLADCEVYFSRKIRRTYLTEVCRSKISEMVQPTGGGCIRLVSR